MQGGLDFQRARGAIQPASPLLQQPGPPAMSLTAQDCATSAGQCTPKQRHCYVTAAPLGTISASERCLMWRSWATRHLSSFANICLLNLIVEPFTTCNDRPRRAIHVYCLQQLNQDRFLTGWWLRISSTSHHQHMYSNT